MNHKAYAKKVARRRQHHAFAKQRNAHHRDAALLELERDLSAKGVRELRKLGTERGVRGASRMTKDDLVSALAKEA